MSFDRIPAELRAQPGPGWVIWRWEGDKKPPYCTSDPSRHASSTNPDTWGTYEQAVGAVALGLADGIGFALAPPYVGVDLDEELPENDRHAIMLALGSYSEVSVSGSGHHVILKAHLNGGRHPKGIGVFQTGRFWYCTGEHVTGTPTTIEERQDELEAVLAEYLPKPEGVTAVTTSPRPVDLDDHELLERAFAARNGDKLRRLWEGDWSEYPSQSEADLALATHLAFWTRRDVGRMDAMFRASGLMREKWQRDDYRASTIEKAIAGTSDVYESKVRPSGAALGTHPASHPEAGVESAGASLRPDVVGTQDGTHPLQPPSVEIREPSLVVVEAAAFAAVEEASAEPLLGDTDGTVLAAGGSAATYGDGGAGKTTLKLDQAFHMCAGAEWLGLPVPRACKVLWIENEGPRGKFREKLAAKFAAWTGPEIEGRLYVLEQPWSLFTFADESHRAELVELIGEREIDVVFAGPVQRLGVEGGGTPAEIQAFVNLLEQVRVELDRPLAYELIHHENKAGDVSGAWEGTTDTLAHVQARGNGHTAIVWRKVRWASELHGQTWKLDWRPGESFELDDTPETTDDAIADQLLGLVREAPGKSWNRYDELVQGKGKRKRVVRDQLVEDGRLVNLGTAKSMRLYLPEQVDMPLLDEDAA